MSTPELKHFPEHRRSPGRDVIGVLPHHPRRDDVRAVLVEADVREALETSVGVNRLCDAPGDTPPSHPPPAFTFCPA